MKSIILPSQESKIVASFVLLETLLAVSYCILDREHPVFSFINLNAEGNFAAWLASMQLFLVGLVFIRRGSQLRSDGKVPVRFLTFVGWLFIYLSADEASAIHERITALFRHVSWMPRFGGKHGTWIIFYLFAILMLAAASWRPARQLSRLFPAPCRLMALGAGIVLSGAVGLEIAGYFFIENSPLFHKLQVALEEFMEMAGVTLILAGTFRMKPPGATVILLEQTPPSFDNAAMTPPAFSSARFFSKR